MKKLLVSLTAILAALPMVAHAANDPITANPQSNAAATNNAPKYQLQSANSAVDGAIATAGYVKGAYNAAIKGVNKVHDEITSAAAAFSLAVENMDGTYATKAGVLATINNASVTGQFNTDLANGSFSGATLTGAAVSGSAVASIPAVTEWGVDSTSNLAAATASLSGVTVSGTMSGSVSGTVAGDTEGHLHAPASYVTGA